VIDMGLKKHNWDVITTLTGEPKIILKCSKCCIWFDITEEILAKYDKQDCIVKD
jgi:hypothetical protein